MKKLLLTLAILLVAGASIMANDTGVSINANNMIEIYNNTYQPIDVQISSLLPIYYDDTHDALFNPATLDAGTTDKTINPGSFFILSRKEGTPSTAEDIAKEVGHPIDINGMPGETEAKAEAEYIRKFSLVHVNIIDPNNSKPDSFIILDIRKIYVPLSLESGSIFSLNFSINTAHMPALPEGLRYANITITQNINK